MHPLESNRQSPEAFEEALLVSTSANRLLTSISLSVNERMTRPLLNGSSSSTFNRSSSVQEQVIVDPENTRSSTFTTFECQDKGKYQPIDCSLTHSD